MGFLSGVLGAVKDENEVTTYDGYITSGNLDSVLKQLQSKIGHGRAGLVESVTLVREWLEGYGKSVKQKNSAIIVPLSTLSSDINTRNDNLKNKQAMTVAVQQKEWAAEAARYVTSAEIAKSALNDLDDKLKDKLKCPINMLLQAVQEFKRTADNDDMVKVLETVESHRQKIQEYAQSQLYRAAEERVKAFFADVDKNVEELVKFIGKVGSAIGEAEGWLTALIRDAQTALEYARTNESNMGALNDKITSDMASQLQSITRQVNELDKTFQRTKKTNDGGLTPAVSGVTAALNTIKGIKGLSISESNILTDFFNGIKGTLDSDVKGNGGRGLNKIIRGVQGYVEKYGQNFAATMGGWVEEICKKEPVHGKLYDYVTQCKKCFIPTKIKPSTSDGMIDELIPIIANVITPIVKQNTNAKGEVAHDLNQIQSFLQGFAGKLSRKESVIVERIESDVIDTSKKRDYDSTLSMYKKNLTRAVEIILPAIVSIAKHAAKELTEFATYSNIGTVNSILSTLDPVINNLQTAAGAGFDGAISTLKSSIQNLSIADIQLQMQTPVAEMNGRIMPTIRDLLVKLNNPNEGVRKTVTQLAELLKNLDGGATSLGKQIETVRQAHVKMKNYMAKEINEAIGTAKRQIRLFIEHIANEIIGKVDNFSKTVNRDTQTLYANNSKRELLKLQNVVETHVGEIGGILYLDFITGSKGLLNTVKGDLDPQGNQVESRYNKLHALQSAIPPATKNPATNVQFAQLAKTFEDYLNEIFAYAGKQINESFSDPIRQAYYGHLEGIYNKFNEVLGHIAKPENIYNYDGTFSQLLAELETRLIEFTSQKFGATSCPILDSVKGGLTRFSAELAKTYINDYAGASPIKWCDADSNPTVDAKKCAKVCLTLLRTLFNDLHELFYYCTTQWQQYTIKGNALHETYDLRDFMLKCGYDFEHLDRVKTGTKVAGRLYQGFLTHGEFKNAPQSKHDFHAYHRSVNNVNDSNTVLLRLVNNMGKYLQVCHLPTPTSPKYPCSVFEIMCWIGGLRYNAYYTNLVDQCRALVNADKYTALTHMASDLHGLHLPAISMRVYDVLLTVAGHGDAATYYGCDYLSNNLGLYYPSDATNCFDMLLDLLRKIYPVLTFLHLQCTAPKSCFGWSECQFGKSVRTSALQCDRNGDKMLYASHDCSVTSPLHEYLTDALRGMLPHAVRSDKSKPVCSTCATGSSKMPCLTPLGFKGFSGSTKTGKDISNVLTKLCSDDGILTAMYESLTCIVNTPPRTFCDIFSFYCLLTKKWKEMPDVYSEREMDPTQNAICKKIMDTVSCKYTDARDFLMPCRNLYHSSYHTEHSGAKSADLEYLVGCGKAGCGYFMKPLNNTAYSVLVPEHAEKYLSWLSYTTQDLATFLAQLTQALTSIDCYEYGCGSCHQDGACETGNHGKKACGCKSVVYCKGIIPTIYKFGFTIGNVKKLITAQFNGCHDFHDILAKLKTCDLLVNWLKAIDNFMFAIRGPFLWMTVALWSLSLLYLICVMVGRLDVLQIRSHLRIRSSHRVTAQSLLAAAQVGRLAKISYLQP